MIDIAKHVRIFDQQPTDDLVTKRTAAIQQLSAFYIGGRPVLDILKTANDLARAAEVRGTLVQSLSDEIWGAVRKASESFISDGQQLQMTVCGLLGALHALDGAKPSIGNLMTPDVLAIGIWLALSFQPSRTEPRLEALRGELQTKAREFNLETAKSARQRRSVPDVSFTAQQPFDTATVGTSLKTAQEAVDTLRANAALDREEIDLLWWVLCDWSEKLAARFSTFDNAPAVAVASGLEVGALLRRMPADAHYHLTLKYAQEGDSLSLPELVEALGDNRGRLALGYDKNQIVAACPAVFPLITALRTESGKGPGTKIKRSLAEWGGRALLESAALHVTAHLPAVLV